ncbi:hypothetical protein, partial [Pararhizobium sp.]|uniref:hypothetical protein n=1 Tax=Pararhizobium sp. TaxID=1977563 RepID=UPI00271DA335
MPFPATFELSALNETDGFRIDGVAVGDQSGYSVASAGDVNGDGIDDLVIGARHANPNGVYSGSSYVVFGKTASFGPSISLASLNGGNGFRIDGAAAGDQSGHSVASAGDVNGDGIDDLIVSARLADPNGSSNAGVSYVVFGSDDGFPEVLNLSDLNGVNGFSISGEAQSDWSGISVSSAGDINGDGISDVLIGAMLADPNGVGGAGAGYVVFGRNTVLEGDFASNLNLSALDGTNGFRINGVAAADSTGFSVSSAGDVNDDGFDDVILGARTADVNGVSSGASYVVYGSDAGFADELNLTDLNGLNGFRISGAMASEYSGYSVASAGDFNGDGIADLIIGAPYASPNGFRSGASYVVFGDAAGFGADLNLGSLNGLNGFRIIGEAEADQSGNWVDSAGDINGDGFDDLIVATRDAGPNGAYSGVTYIVFGAAASVGASFSLSSLNGTNGFQVNGVAADDRSGRSAAAAGDVNGDGIDDLIIGALGANQETGASYIIYGRLDFTGGGTNDARSGGAVADSLRGQGGNDVLYGMGGDDVLDGGDLSDILYGGDGADDLVGGGGGDVMYGDAGDDQIDGGEGGDKLFGGLGADQLFGGLGNDRFDGGDGIDSLNGGQGNDYLDGGAGADVMTGGTENDIYLVDDLGDQTIEAPDEGYDIVRTELDGWVLAGNLEGLQLEGAGDIDGTGNGLANNIQGSSGANTIYGLAGNDTINGNDGNDIIVGGLGGDQLRGGAGADSFVIGQESTVARTELDQIHDFSIT